MSQSYQDHEYDPAAIWTALEAALEKKVELAAKARLLDELKKPTLAKLTLKHMAGGGSKAAAETKALADPEYDEYVRGMVEAGRLADLATGKYYDLKTLHEARRTFETSRRGLVG